ncbi:MAG: DNA alkylation repair protein, partial [Bryobacteraceae bacterium]
HVNREADGANVQRRLRNSQAMCMVMSGMLSQIPSRREPVMTPDELLLSVRAQMKAYADPHMAQGQRAYFKEPIDPWGVRGIHIKKIEQSVYGEVKHWPGQERNRLCTDLLKGGRLEEGVLAIHLYRRFRSQCAAREFKLFERWIDRYVQTWAHCDGIASWLLAACIENQPDLSGKLPDWTRSRNRWKRRAAAVALLQEAKQGRHTQEIFRIVDLLSEDKDDMVQKGVGWLLKEAYPLKPRETLRYLRFWSGPRIVLRYAMEKMSPEHRAELGLKR